MIKKKPGVIVFSKAKGETIVEILVAMTILTIIITSVYSILLRASKTNTSVKNRVIALNIARDGLEGVRNIRDTNWLKYSGDRRNRWLCRPGYADYDATDSDVPKRPQNPKVGYSFINPITNNYFFPKDFEDPLVQETWIDNCMSDLATEPGYYILERVSYLDDTNATEQVDPVRFVLEPKYDITTPSVTLDGNRGEFRLHYFTRPGGESYHYTHAIGRYAEQVCGPGVCVLPLQEFPQSPFYRKIKIEVVSPFEDPDNAPSALDDPDGDLNEYDPNDLCADGSLCETSKLKVTSIVEWQEEDAWESLTLEAHLFDFYERTGY